MDSTYYIGPFGTEYWLDKNNEFHRVDGPAVMYKNGDNHWYVHGVGVDTNKDYQSLANLSDEDMLVIVIKYGNVSL